MKQESPDYAVKQHFFPAPRRWNAYWIWPEGEESPVNSYYYFRREAEFSSLPAKAYVHITSETHYQLYINGRKVGYGPAQSIGYLQYYDTYDVSELLQAGSNTIAVVVNHVGVNPSSVGGLLLEITDESGRPLLCTDDKWRAKRADAWSSNTYKFRMSVYNPFQEMYDSRREPTGWMQASFNDSGWRKAAIRNGIRSNRPPAVTPWSYLVPRDIPFMKETVRRPVGIVRMEETVDLINRMRSDDLSIALSMPGSELLHTEVVNPEHLLTGESSVTVRCSTGHLDHSIDGMYSPALTLDFGRSLNAFLEIDIEGPSGATVEVGYAERLLNGHFNNALEGQFATRYTLNGKRQKLRSFTWKSFQYIKIIFRGCQEPATIHEIVANVTEYPFLPQGSFQSSDERVNRIYDISRYTIGLCCNESIMDTPWREQAQFTGDVAGVTLGGIYSCFGDTALPGKFLRQSASNQLQTGLLTSVTNSFAVPSHHDWQTVHPDYSLWWVFGLWNHYMYTGQQEWIHKFYPHVLKIANAFLQYQGEHGLIERMPYALFIDWADVERGGECGALNAIVYGVLGLVQQMAELRGDRYAMDQIREARTAIRTSFVERLYDQEAKCFADANIDGVLSDKHGEQVNSAALYWQLCDDELGQSIIDRLYVDRAVRYTEAQPFFTSVVLRALSRLERTEIALQLIEDRWGKRMVDRGAASTYEEWQLNGSWRKGTFGAVMRTQSHAWSAFPAEYFIRLQAGIEIVAPGCTVMRVAPRPAPFDYTVAFPTPLGNVKVEYRSGKPTIEAPDAIQIQT